MEIEKFTKQLIDLSKMEQKVVSEKANVEMDAFILQLEHQMKALSLEKCLEVIVEKDNLPASIFMDKELFLSSNVESDCQCSRAFAN